MKNYVPRLPNYINNLKNLGRADDAEFGNGCSDKLVDAIVAWGSEKQIQDRVEANRKAGATHVWIQPLHPDNGAHTDLKASRHRSARLAPIDTTPESGQARSAVLIV